MCLRVEKTIEIVSMVCLCPIVEIVEIVNMVCLCPTVEIVEIVRVVGLSCLMGISSVNWHLNVVIIP